MDQLGIAIVTAVFFVVQPMAGYGAAIVAGFGFIALVIVFAGIIGLVDLARGRAKARQEGQPVRS